MEWSLENPYLTFFLILAVLEVVVRGITLSSANDQNDDDDQEDEI